MSQDVIKVTENKPYRVHIRLTESEKQFIENVSYNFGLTISDTIRMFIDKYISDSRGNHDENKKTDIQHII